MPGRRAAKAKRGRGCATLVCVCVRGGPASMRTSCPSLRTVQQQAVLVNLSQNKNLGRISGVGLLQRALGRRRTPAARSRVNLCRRVDIGYTLGASSSAETRDVDEDCRKSKKALLFRHPVRPSKETARSRPPHAANIPKISQSPENACCTWTKLGRFRWASSPPQH